MFFTLAQDESLCTDATATQPRTKLRARLDQRRARLGPPRGRGHPVRVGGHPCGDVRHLAPHAGDGCVHLGAGGAFEETLLRLPRKPCAGKRGEIDDGESSL